MSRAPIQRTFQGGFDLSRGVGEILDHLADVERGLERLQEAFREAFPAKRNGDVYLRLRLARRGVGGEEREVPVGAEWRALDIPRGWRGEGCRSRNLGTHLSLAAIRRSNLAAHAERVHRFDRRLGQFLALRRRIVAALDAARKQVQATLRACEADWVGGLDWADAALRGAG